MANFKDYHAARIRLIRELGDAFTIQAVADDLGISLDEANKLQLDMDEFKRKSQEDFTNDKIRLYDGIMARGTSKRTQPYYKGGRKSRRYSKKSGRKSRRHSKKSSKRSCRR